MQKVIHYLEGSLVDPVHPIQILLVGLGGTGSQVLNCLGRMSYALKKMGHPGFHVTALDKDKVEEFNVGRQLFSQSEIGENKAICAVTKINRFFGFSWEAKEGLLDEKYLDRISQNPQQQCQNIIISCVDNVSTRRIIANWKSTGFNPVREYQSYYWMDFGNSQKAGQVILGSIVAAKNGPEKNPFLRNVFDLFPKMEDFEQVSGPSCSMAEALGKQDLFINSTLAGIGSHLLWNLILNKQIDYHGAFLNMATLEVRPVPIKDKIIVQPKTKLSTGLK